MRVVLFCHSLLSDWNHGNAHFLRGVASELVRRGHSVSVFEPRDAWSLRNLVEAHGRGPLHGFRRAYPLLRVTRYDLRRLDLDRALDGARLVLVHEWNDQELVKRVGAHRAAGGRYRLFFHDTHHRALTRPQEMAGYDLRHYDGVLAFGSVLRDMYLRRGWAARAFTWHEAADTCVFHPRAAAARDGDLVWIGNWGDEERTGELARFLLRPVTRLSLRGRAYGVRYPRAARLALARASLEYGGWLPNFAVPDAYARFRVTVHVPRRPYARALPGIPTIRPFEALACGIPLVSAPWEDAEGLFNPGHDYLVARSEAEMTRHLRDVLNDDDLARSLRDRGLMTIEARHTCAHRVDQLLAIRDELEAGARRVA
jgi:spore maturation protein CgeB